MIKVKSGETITLFVETYDVTPTAEERAEAGVDDEFVLYTKNPRQLGSAPIVAARYGEDGKGNWFTNPDGSGRLVITVQPGQNSLEFTMVIGNSRYTMGRIECRLPDGAFVTVGEASADYPRHGFVIEGI